MSIALVVLCDVGLDVDFGVDEVVEIVELEMEEVETARISVLVIVVVEEYVVVSVTWPSTAKGVRRTVSVAAMCVNSMAADCSRIWRDFLE